VGFNPYHRHRRTNADTLMLVAAGAVVLLLLVWVVLG
jgi:hypothetical protein